MKLSDTEILINATPFPLRLTLGALAEIEESLGVQDIISLTARLKQPTAYDLLIILQALLKAGGTVFSKESLEQADISFSDLLRAIAKSFSAAMAMEAPEKPKAATNVG